MHYEVHYRHRWKAPEREKNKPKRKTDVANGRGEQLSMDVIGLGALNVDLIYEVDLAFPEIEFGRERMAKYEEFKELLNLLKNKGKLKSKSGGGSAANTIYALAKMGFSTGYIGKVGRDEEGKFLLRELKMVGVDISKIQRNEKSGICIALLNRKGERSILILPHANDKLLYSEVDLNYLNRAKIVHMTSFIGNEPFQVQKIIASQLKTRISFNPGEPHIKRGIEELRPILERTFVLFATGKEIEMLTGKDYKRGTRILLDYGIKIAICTLGEKGSYLLSGKEKLRIPAEKVKIIDTTGAGDVYAAGFLAGLLKKLPLFECARLATRAAAQSIKGYGRNSYPDKYLVNSESKFVASY